MTPGFFEKLTDQARRILAGENPAVVLTGEKVEIPTHQTVSVDEINKIRTEAAARELEKAHLTKSN